MKWNDYEKVERTANDKRADVLCTEPIIDFRKRFGTGPPFDLLKDSTIIGSAQIWK